MEEKQTLIKTLLSNAEEYGKTTVELIKLKTVEKVADSASGFIAWAVVVIALVVFFITLNFGLAYLIGDLLGQKVYLGFFIIAAFYGIAGMLFFIFRNKWIKKPVNESIINQMLN